MTILNSVGWVATAIFSTSYFCKQATTLRRIQAAAALLWVVYGFLLGAAPAIVANLIVAAAAIYSSVRTPRTALAKDTYLWLARLKRVWRAAGLYSLPTLLNRRG